MTHLIDHYGLAFLFAIVALESAGVWLPGETALIAAGVYAAKGHLSIAAVIAVAAAGAIVGDNVGYWLGRGGGRRLLERYSFLRRFTGRALPAAERFFERHGGKAVFLGRFFAGLRVTAAWMAGITRMEWWRFLLWNAAGGVVWAVAVGLVAFYAGRTVADTISRYGVYGGIAAGVLVVLGLAGMHVWRHRIAESGA